MQKKCVSELQFMLKFPKPKSSIFSGRPGGGSCETGHYSVKHLKNIITYQADLINFYMIYSPTSIKS